MKIHQTMLCMQSLLIMITGVYGIEKQKLLYHTFSYLKEIDMDTGVVQTLTIQNERVFSLAYDNKESLMYVPRYDTGDIVRFSYPTNQTVMLETIVSAWYPFGIAFDSLNKHVYWTELYLAGRIMRCNPDGFDRTVLLNETRPTALTLDIQNRWIYYGQEMFNGKIFRINFDGMDKRIIIRNVPASVYGIGVDVDVKRFYWMEYHTGDLRSACYNGSDVKTIINTNATHSNWDIGIDKDFIFYTSKTQIMKINKLLVQNPTVVYTDSLNIFGILLYQQDGMKCGFGPNSNSIKLYTSSKKQNVRRGFVFIALLCILVLTTSAGRADRTKRSFLNMYSQISHLFEMGYTFGNYLRDYGYGVELAEAVHLKTTFIDSPGSYDYENCNCDKEFLEYLRSASFPRTSLLGLLNFDKC